MVIVVIIFEQNVDYGVWRYFSIIISVIYLLMFQRACSTIFRLSKGTYKFSFHVVAAWHLRCSAFSSSLFCPLKIVFHRSDNNTRLIIYTFCAMLRIGPLKLHFNHWFFDNFCLFCVTFEKFLLGITLKWIKLINCPGNNVILIPEYCFSCK